MDTTRVVPTTFRIGDRTLSVASGGEMEHVNPANGEVTAAFPLAATEELDEAASVGRSALGQWAAVPGARRAEIPRSIASTIRSEHAQLSALTTLEAGAPVATADFVTAGSADWFDYYAGWADRLIGEQIPMPRMLDYTVHEPVGVVALVLTWNAPITGIGMKAAAALVAGCSVIVKPPELAPYTLLRFAELCSEAGLPDGVLTVLSGDGRLGEALVSHLGVAKVSFTGGPETGRRVQAVAACNVTPVLLELGGKSANLVFDDADIERAVGASVRAHHDGRPDLRGRDPAVRAAWRLRAGGRRPAGVPRPRHDRRRHRPRDPHGAVISEAAATRLAGHISSAKERGDGELVCGGDRLERAGSYLRPTVFADVDNNCSLVQEELFGPVLAVTPFDDEDEAVALANDTKYGLAAYVHTNNLARAHRLASRLDAGLVSMNGAMPATAPHAPFSGFKGSGYGKEGGLSGILEFCRTKNVCVAL
ncbi:aldehyde dehydrogenase family protein [Streptomyces sp. NBC_01320]|nr:aldehyde dehydrogenase family protein [Streptomyces sp. NBC_01320]